MGDQATWKSPSLLLRLPNRRSIAVMLFLRAHCRVVRLKLPSLATSYMLCFELETSLLEKIMEKSVNDPDVIERTLSRRPRVAVVGLSSKPERASNLVARYLSSHGFEVVPVNPKEEEILGHNSYPSVASVPGKVDVVDIFRKPEDVGPIVEEAIEKGVEVVWMQLGVVNDEAARRALEAGLDVVMDRCMKKELERLEEG